MGKKKQKELSESAENVAQTENASGATDTPNALSASVANDEKAYRIHYYVKIAVSTFLCALLLLIGVPVFMESRVTGSLAYTALGVVLVAFGLILALAVVVLLFNPPFKARINK
ncbi:hypothetical protein [Adlercreutzia sp. ZJ154]|uniref:hypothetical protein n=1 Tax=Adlercreutzia sp. ZJ154 TaxID=2709790 RepID=UPI0013EDE267|nr:hypothetical protein [Adlercreutzia sp. ZJ154]